MKRICLIGASLFLIACGGLKRDDVVKWFDAKMEPPAIEVGGGWDSPNSYFNGGWGSGTWLQTGSRVSGRLGLYDIDGKVAGHKVYLAILNGSKPAYTAVLELKDGNKLEGLAFPEVIADSEKARSTQPAPVILVRAKN